MTKLNTGVYIILNKINRKRYVGSAAVDLTKRWENGHRKLLRVRGHCNRHLQASWNKYGEAAFQFIVLERCVPEQCLEREQYWLDVLKTWKRENGYNLCQKAGSVLGLEWTEESKQQQSNRRRKWNKENPEKAKHLTDAMNAHNKEHKGEGFMDAAHVEAVRQNMLINREKRGGNSPETRAKISIASKGKPKSDETKARMLAANRKRLETWQLTPRQQWSIKINGLRGTYTRFGKSQGYATLEDYIRVRKPEYLPFYHALENGTPLPIE